MKRLDERRAIWFGRANDERLFYPFGIKSQGYIVPEAQRRKILRWTRWRVHTPLIFAAIYFLPLIGFWGPSLSASGRLDAGTLALSFLALLMAALASAVLLDRAAYAWLLRGCAALDRLPTRSERGSSSGQVTQTFANRHFAPLPVRVLCLGVGLANTILGWIHGDPWLMLSGLLVAAIFAVNVLKDCGGRVHFWLLWDAAHTERRDH